MNKIDIVKRTSATNPVNEEGHRLQRTLTWKSGVGIALAIPSAVVVTLGASVGALGTWTALCIWLTATAIASLQNVLFSEMAAMYPNRSGGIARFAIEGWKRHCAPLGSVASFGYWMAWSFSLSVFAVTVGSLVKAQWFPDSTWSFSAFGRESGIEHIFAIVSVIFVWAINYFGVKNTVRLNIAAGAVFIIGIVVIVVGSLSSDRFSIDNLTWGGQLDIVTIIVWFYLTCWTTYGTEMVLSFTPEYRDPVRDITKALRAISLVMLLLLLFLPIAISGAVGEQVIADNPSTYIIVLFTEVLGQGSWMGTTLLIAALLMGMNAGTADGGRALYGLARDGMTLKQLDHLNRWNVPGRSLTLDAGLNVIIILTVGSPLAILLAGNLGYLFAVTLATSAFLLLRRDRPDQQRPIRLGPVWIFVAVACLGLNLIVLAVGVINPEASGYGGIQETAIGIAILLSAVLMFIYRRIVQDKLPMAWRIVDDEDALT